MNKKLRIRSRNLKTTPDILLRYLDIATKFRNHEFNIQMIRNFIFTGAEAGLFGSLIATNTQNIFIPFFISLFGILLTMLWYYYYRGAKFWAWYWEWRCRQVNDLVVDKLKIDVNIFKNHPSGSTDKNIPSFFYFGKNIKHVQVHKVIQLTQLLFVLVWFAMTLFFGYVILIKKFCVTDVFNIIDFFSL